MRHQVFVATTEQDIFLPAPIAAADVDTDKRAGYSIDDAIDQLHRVFQLALRACLRRQNPSHEGVGFRLSGEDDFREHRLVELHHLDARSRQRLEFVMQDRHEVV